MRGLCHTCHKSNLSIIVNASSGWPECTTCLKKEAETRKPDLTCYCRECQVHNPTVSVNPAPIESDIKVIESVEG